MVTVERMVIVQPVMIRGFVDNDDKNVMEAATSKAVGEAGGGDGVLKLVK